ncbi:MAG: 1-acyl-sn-glycerol-3-phosphate acyltransferase [Spirochaetaceae bacterium]|nr:1-acyl-sn-glycerol-3-phosphate acyltransferase [Spirochaetaceae bacterium]
MTIYTALIRQFFILLGLEGQRRKLHKLAKKGLIKERDELAFSIAQNWGRNLIKSVGGKETTVTVIGQENIPSDTSVVFIANHQSFLDIPLMFGYAGRQAGFISKAEFSKIPIFADWMRILQCIFLKRGNPKQSIQAMADGVENIKRGYSMMIFPEGHRSKSSEVHEFHAGSFKLAYRAEVPIVPVTISNTYKMYEETGHSQATNLTLIFHPAIITKGLSREEQKEIPGKVQALLTESVKSLQILKK